MQRWHAEELYNGFSPYNYVLNNPVNYFDVLGLAPDSFGNDPEEDQGKKQKYDLLGNPIKEDDYIAFYAIGKEVQVTAEWVGHGGEEVEPMDPLGFLTDYGDYGGQDKDRSPQMLSYSQNLYSFTGVEQKSYNNKYSSDEQYAIGIGVSAGLGLFYQGFEVGFGIVGLPGSVGQAYFSVAIPKHPLYLNGSISSQLLFVRSRGGKVDLSGDGRSLGVGMGRFAGSYSQGLNDKGKITTDIVGVGAGMGAKYTGGYTRTKTWTLSCYIPMLITLIPK